MIDRKKHKEQLNLDNSDNKRSSLKSALALAGLLSFSHVQADLTSPTPTNLLISPVYSFFPGNVYYDILWDDDDLSKNPKLQKTFNASLKILKKYIHLDKEKVKEINRNYLKLFNQIHKNKEYPAGKFVEDFIDLSLKQGLSYNQSINLFLDYYNNHFLPEDFSNKFAKDFKYKLGEYLGTYNNKEFEKKFQKLIKLYENGSLTKQNVKSIFPKIKKMEKRKEKVDKTLSFILLGMLIFFLGGVALYDL